MKAIILAAGQGTRMGSETDDKPKCMITYKGKPLINYTIETMRACGIKDIVIIDGYKSEVLQSYLSNDNVIFITNKEFYKTNMVYTLFCAESEMNDDLIISYGDIIYTKEVLQSLIQNNNDFAITVDKNWRELWKLRMDDPLKDAETMKLDDSCNIIELGRKSKSYKEINGQYIGLVKISNSILKRVRNFYHDLDSSKYYDGKDYINMYMTSFIQLLINSGYPVKADIIRNGWLEFDSQDDLIVYESQRNLLLTKNF
jgi:choline kinase